MVSLAEIITDGTVGASVNLNGPDFIINDSLGTRSGNNLFHSFKTFDIHVNEQATFTGSADIENVISRVTGGQASVINGLLNSQVGQAHFFFLNPAGVFFGEHAEINVPSVFHISTASELHFSDGSVFSAQDLNKSTLGIAQPEAFGFLSAQSSRIVINGSQFNFSPDSSAYFTAGDIAVNNASLLSQEGHIYLLAVGKSANGKSVSLSDNGVITNDLQGQLSINTSEIVTFGDGAGSLLLSAGSAELINSQIINTNIGNKPSQDSTQIYVRQLSLDNSSIQNNARSEGKTSSLEIVSLGDVTLSNHSYIQAAVQDTDSTENISIIAAGTLSVLSGSAIFSETYGTANAGNISIDAHELLINEQGANAFTGLSSHTRSASQGNSGDVLIDVAGTVKLVNGGVIRSSTFSQGNAGKVELHADNVLIDGQGADFLTAISAQANATEEGIIGGDAGNVLINVKNMLTILNGGQINSNTMGDGDAGQIIIHSNRLFIDDQNSQFITGISSSSIAGAKGDAGNIIIDIDDKAELYNGAKIATGTFGQGHSGNIELSSAHLLINGKGSGTGITSQSDLDASGRAGNVLITIENGLELLNGGGITSSSYGNNDAGSVTIFADHLLIDGSGSDNITKITSQVNSIEGGQAGIVDITIDDWIDIRNGAYIASDSHGIGNAGIVSIEASSLQLSYFANIGSQVAEHSQGNAGNVILDISESLSIYSGSEISSSTFGAGNAGTLSIQTTNLIIDSQTIDAFTGIASQANNPATGIAGDITINSDVINLANGAQISIAHFGELSDVLSSQASLTGRLAINAKTMALFSSSEITAQATGNSAASHIELTIHEFLNVADGSEITTSANIGNGGEIYISGDANVMLNNALITTSTNKGDGGNIIIDSNALIMNTGFIQANTATGAKGGNIAINTSYLLTPKAILPEVGGLEREDFVMNSGRNIIQAAAPEGNPGILAISTPEMDINATLAILSGQFLLHRPIIKQACVLGAKQKISTLLALGRGGSPNKPREPSSVSFAGHRLDQLLNTSDL